MSNSLGSVSPHLECGQPSLVADLLCPTLLAPYHHISSERSTSLVADLLCPTLLAPYHHISSAVNLHLLLASSVSNSLGSVSPHLELVNLHLLLIFCVNSLGSVSPHLECGQPSLVADLLCPTLLAPYHHISSVVNLHLLLIFCVQLSWLRITTSRVSVNLHLLLIFCVNSLGSVSPHLEWTLGLGPL